MSSADTAEVRAALEQRVAPGETRTVVQLLDVMRPEVERLLGSRQLAERFVRTVLTEARRTPKLLECSPPSLLGAMMLAAQLGLEPGPLGHVYLVPYKGEVEFIIGYRGMIDLAYRSGQLRDLSARIVYDGDDFDFRERTRPYLDHRPAGPPGERDMTHAYAVGRTRSGGAPFVVTYPEDWERAKQRSAAGSRGSGPWVTDFPAMVRKTAVRRLQPFLPQSATDAWALDADEQVAEPLDVNAVIDAEAVEA
jgi:recombination protein RecT